MKKNVLYEKNYLFNVVQLLLNLQILSSLISFVKQKFGLVK